MLILQVTLQRSILGKTFIKNQHMPILAVTKWVLNHLRKAVLKDF